MRDFTDKIKSYIPGPGKGKIMPVKVIKKIRAKNCDALLIDDDSLTGLNYSSGDTMPFVVIDFGKEITGYLRVEFVVNGRVKVETSFGESLEECIKGPTEHQNAIPLSLGKETIELEKRTSDGGLEYVIWAPMVWRAFRYVKIKSSGRVNIRSISARLFTYPAEYAGYFLSSDELLNRIWVSGAYTVLLCMRPYYYVDGPKRDNNLWVGDVHVESLVSYYAFGVSQLTRNTLWLVSQHQRGDGSIPASDFRGFESRFIDWYAFWIIILRDYYQYSGDRDFILSCKNILLKQMEWFIKRTNRHGMIEKNAGEFDWAYSLNRPGEVSYIQMCCYKALIDASWLLGIAGDKKRSSYYLKMANKLKITINKVFWSDEQGVYVDYRTGDIVSRHVSEDSNVFAVLYGVAGRDRTDRILKYLKKKMWSPYGSKLLDRPYLRGDKDTPSLLGNRHNRKIWPFANFYEVEAHFNSGNENDAIELIRRCWGNMLKRGATTFWEWVEEDGSIPEIFTSLCHGFSAGAAYSLQANVLGIKPAKPGFSEFSIMPHLGPLSWAEGAVPTPKGQIIVSLKKDGGTFSAEITVPAGISGDIAIPKIKTGRRKISIGGTPVYFNGRVIKKLPFIKNIHEDDKYVHFFVSSGKLSEGSRRLLFRTG